MTDNQNGGMYMPVAPAYGAGTGMGTGFGGDGWWILLLFILLGGNNWGGNNGFGGNGLYPWLNNAQTFGEVQNSLCNGFAGVTQQLSANQIADMERSFAAQTASTQGMTALQAQLAQCCCDNRAATADLKYTVATENCADRAALSDGIQALLTAQNAATQRILDTMCQDKIDAKNEKIADLQRQLTMANLAASQGAQTAAILANNEAQTAALEQYLAPVPRPAYIVQNPNGCGQTYGCTCAG